MEADLYCRLGHTHSLGNILHAVHVPVFPHEDQPNAVMPFEKQLVQIGRFRAKLRRHKEMVIAFHPRTADVTVQRVVTRRPIAGPNRNREIRSVPLNIFQTAQVERPERRAFVAVMAGDAVTVENRLQSLFLNCSVLS